MITVNSISGGKTSAYMAIHYPADVEIFACVCIDAPECAPKDPAVLKYCLDKLGGSFIASAEHDKTLKVMMDLEQIIGKEIVWVRGKSFDQIIDENSSLPSWNRRFCTIEMKIYPIFEYVYPRYGKVIMNIGFRGDERERIIRGKENKIIKYPTSVRIPSTKESFEELLDIYIKNPGINALDAFKIKYLQNSIVDYDGYILKARRRKWEEIEWRETNFPLEKTFHFEIIKFLKTFYPDLDFPDDSNCRGCPHKPEELIKKNWLETPEVLEWFARQEEKKTGRKIHTWKDSMIPYRDVFKMNFTEEIDFKDFTMCNSGGCTD